MWMPRRCRKLGFAIHGHAYLPEEIVVNECSGRDCTRYKRKQMPERADAQCFAVPAGTKWKCRCRDSRAENCCVPR
jgi:hypothetical protein